MLHENLKNFRKAKGLSQEGLAEELHVVRQTVSKWEQGLSVPDAEHLIRIAQVLDTTVTVLLGETVILEEAPALAVLSEKLELLNRQMAQQQERRRRTLQILLSLVLAVSLIFLVAYMVPFGENLSAIGGVDGPTAITVVSGPMSGFLGFCMAILVAIASVVGLCKLRKK